MSNFRPEFDNFYQLIKIESKYAGDWNIPDNDNDNLFYFATERKSGAYGESPLVVVNKDLEINTIDETIDGGLERISNVSFSISNLDKFYSRMVEANPTRNPFQSCTITIYDCSGYVPSLFFDGADWKDVEGNVYAFTPDEPYPLTDAFYKVFEGRVDQVKQDLKRVQFRCISEENSKDNVIGEYLTPASHS